MNNTINDDTCYYATYAKIKGNPTEKECSNPATRHIENRLLLKNFLYVKNIIRKKFQSKAVRSRIPVINTAIISKLDLNEDRSNHMANKSCSS